MAGIIRKEQPTVARTFSFANLEDQGRRILERATAQADQIVQAAREEARQLAAREKAAGYQTGLAEGREAGLKQIRAEARANAVQEAQARVTALVNALSVTLTEFEQNKRGLLAAAESGLIALALAIARRVCKLEAGAATSSASANARALLDMVQHAEDAELHLHPDEYKLLREMGPELPAQAERFAHVNLVADDRVDRGGCLLRTRAGEIDATIETQLQRIAEALRVSTNPTRPAPPSDP